MRAAASAIACGLLITGCGDWQSGLGASGPPLVLDGGDDATLFEAGGDDAPGDSATSDQGADTTADAPADVAPDVPYDGPPKGLGDACAASTECQSGHCVDGVCCSTTCGTTCWQCNGAGTAGTCTLVPNGQADAPGCDGTHVCNGGGVCVGGIGQPCANGTQCTSYLCVDGVCCDSACAGICQACDVPGFVGTCSPVPAGQHDDYPAGICSAPSQCNGTGSCLHANGTGCGANDQCISGHCVDGFCCDTACDAVCYACSLAGSYGSCKPIAKGQTDWSPVCSGLQACNGAGACLAATGQPCTVDGDCASGKCSGGRCQ